MYIIIEKLITNRKLTAYKVAKATNIDPSSFTDWKSGKCKPSAAALKKLAEFFNVSVDYLLIGEQEEPTTRREGEFMEMILKYVEEQEAKKKK